ncbi:methyltransferase domain-containing protein [Ilyomonas limi]|uniref:Methyltransferase domain-containing protein n=1 Tax=Ilyomonas limi TaxID=2575867 RepID=A0A4U3L7B3_9BACT|nr:methyltransferase domain-containing protein [Ilyomonas limi]TKK70339.1 methyltransferase domain-containing protein [Ilyomonas limi]
MNYKIDSHFLAEITRHHRLQGYTYAIKSLSYERCAELPYILQQLQHRFKEKLNFLDIGSGESPLPTYLLVHTNWNIYCVDKFNWVQKQKDFARKFMPDIEIEKRLHIVEKDFLIEKFQERFYDIITNISVIEHFEGVTDSTAMKLSAQLLKPGGIYILTTLINEGFYKEFYVKGNVYGEQSRTNQKVFWQRHYDVNSVQERLIKPSGLKEVNRIYFGDYNYRFYEKLLKLPKLLKPVKVLYSWATPFFAKKYLHYSDSPISYSDMKMDTSSGIILTFSK